MADVRCVEFSLLAHGYVNTNVAHACAYELEKHVRSVYRVPHIRAVYHGPGQLRQVISVYANTDTGVPLAVVSSAALFIEQFLNKGGANG